MLEPDIEAQIIVTARDWTRYYDLAQRTNYPKDHDMADREATQLRNLCRKLKRAERRAMKILEAPEGTPIPKEEG